MGIPVVYHDGMMDIVDSVKLQKLIEYDGILKFQRDGVWIYPEVGPVRSSFSSEYDGPERRLL